MPYAAMIDPTESTRRRMVKTINDNAGDRAELEHLHGKVWDTHELQAEFTVVAFMAPYVTVKRKTDGVRGTMLFQHSPRLYYAFQEIQ